MFVWVPDDQSYTVDSYTQSGTVNAPNTTPLCILLPLILVFFVTMGAYIYSEKRAENRS